MIHNPRPPAKGEIQIAVLLGDATFLAWAPAADVDELMDAFERRARLTEADRTDQVAHADVRRRIASGLRTGDAERLFTVVLAAGCLWLALRHWSNAETMRKGLDAKMAATGFAVVTAAIADPAPAGSMADTAWAFMIGSRIHDFRDKLANMPPAQVEVIDNMGDGDND